MPYNLANMTPSDRARMPGNWQELEDVQDLSAVTRVWWKDYEVDEVEPGTFQHSTAPQGDPPGRNVGLAGFAYTVTNGRRVTRELDDIIGVEVGA